MPKLIGFIASIVICFAFVKSAYAVTVTLSDYPQTITQDPFTLTVTVNGASAATNYLRVDLYKDGSTNYFGETYNNSDWYSGSDYTQYFPITIDSSKKWTGQVQARTASPTISQYDSQGSYKLRIRRYTNSGGTDASEANSGAVAVNINIPKASPTPTPSPSSSPSSNSPSPSTSTPKSPSPTPISIKSPTPSPKPSGEVLGQDESATPSSQLSTDSSQTPTPSPKADTNPRTKVAALLTGSGAIIVGLSVAFFLWYRKVLETDKESKD